MIIKCSMNYDRHGRKIKRKTQPRKKRQGAVAQLGERRTCTAKVVGSIPSSSTSKKDDFIERLKEHSKRFGNTSLTNNQWKLEESKKHTIAPAYNKGAYQVIPRNEVKDIGK